MDKLRDIKGLVEIQDYSLYYLLALVSFGLLIASFMIYQLFFKRKRRKKPTKKEIALRELKNIDYSNPKDIAYKFTIFAGSFLEESDKREYEMLVKELDSYKYKKEIPNMDEDLKKRVKNFIKGLR